MTLLVRAHGGASGNGRNSMILEPYKNLIPNNVRIPLTNLESHQEQHRSTRATKPDGGSP